MGNIALHNATRVNITAKKDDDFSLNLKITDAFGADVEYYSNPLLLFSITDSSDNPVAIATNRDMIPLSPPNLAGSTVDVVGRILGKQAGYNTELERNGYQYDIMGELYLSTLDGLTFSILDSTKEHTVVKGTVLGMAVSFPYYNFDLPKGSYKYTYKIIRELEGIPIHINTVLYGTLKVV